MKNAMQNHHWKIGVLACMFIVGVGALCDGLAKRNTGNSNHCVLKIPLVAVSGYISHPGMFHRGDTRYSISYRGTTKSTGETCSKSVWVTMSEYERVMYGREN